MVGILKIKYKNEQGSSICRDFAICTLVGSTPLTSGQQKSLQIELPCSFLYLIFNISTMHFVFCILYFCICTLVGTTPLTSGQQKSLQIELPCSSFCIFFSVLQFCNFVFLYLSICSLTGSTYKCSANFNFADFASPCVCTFIFTLP